MNNLSNYIPWWMQEFRAHNCDASNPTNMVAPFSSVALLHLDTLNSYDKCDSECAWSNRSIDLFRNCIDPKNIYRRLHRSLECDRCAGQHVFGIHRMFRTAPNIVSIHIANRLLHYVELVFDQFVGPISKIYEKSINSKLL